MKITPERKAAAQKLGRVPLSTAGGSPTNLTRATAAYLAAVKGMEADQNRVGVHGFPGLRFEDASGDDGLAFVHPLALDRCVMLALTAAEESGQPGDGIHSEVTHAYSPGQARALAFALLVLADEAEADTTEVGP